LKLLPRDGYDVVLVARTEASLVRLADELRDPFGVRTTVIVADLSRDDAAQRPTSCGASSMWTCS
jgi:short-subunit dehydrogenase